MVGDGGEATAVSNDNAARALAREEEEEQVAWHNAEVEVGSMGCKTAEGAGGSSNERLEGVEGRSLVVGVEEAFVG